MENEKKLKSINENLEFLKKMKDSIVYDLEQKKREMRSLIPEDLIPNKENLEGSPREQMISKDSLKSFKKTKTGIQSKHESKKKKGQAEVKDYCKQEERALFEEIRKVYCEVLDIKNSSLIKKMSPLEMMTKVDSYFESSVGLTR